MATKALNADTDMPGSTGSEENVGILRNAKLLGIIGIVILVVAVGVYYLITGQASSNQEAQLALARIRPYYDRGEYATAITADSALPVGPVRPKGLRYIVDEWGSTKVGKIATLYLGNSYLATGEAPKAKEPYDIATGSDHELVRAAAHAGLAAVAEASGAYAEAADEYVKAAAEDKLELNAPDYMIGAARNFEQAGKMEEAKDYYRRVATQFGGTQVNSQANVQARLALARLKVDL